MSCKSSVAMTVVVIVVMFVIMVMIVPRAAMVRTIGTTFGLKRFFHGVHN